MNHYFLALLLPIAAATPTFAAIQLTFADLSDSNFGTAGNTTLDYGLVGNDGTNDIYARITALSTFDANEAGAENGDVHIRTEADNTAQLRLSLFQDASYMISYDPGVTYSWTSTFADIEGSKNNPSTIYESITIRTAGSFEIANNTALNISANNGLSTTFSGQGASTYTNPTTDILTPEQSEVAVAYTATDISSIDFDYTSVGQQRSMFIDVGNLQFDESVTTGTYTVGAIPEPAAAGLLLGAVGISIALLRRKRV